MADVRGTTNAYLVFLVLLMIGLAGVAVRISEPPGVRDALLALLVIGCTVLAIAVPVHVGPQQKHTLYGSVVFAAVLLLDPMLAITGVGLGTMVGQLLRRVPKVELLFNVLQTMLQTSAGSCVLWWAGWNFDTLAIGDEEFVPILLTILVIEAVNIILVAGIITLESTESLVSAVRAVARQDLVSMATPYALGLLAAIVVDAHIWAFPLLALLAVEVRRSSERHAKLRQQAMVMEHQALHDALTGLPNRRMFVARVEQALARASRHQQRLAVMFVDLDRFKIVNDTLGHLAGDKLLVAVTQRLSRRIRQQDTFARLGGDEFTLLTEDIDDTRDAEAMAHRLVESLQDPFVINGHRIAVSASIGYAFNLPGQTTADDIIRHADIALYHAKARGGNSIVSFNSRDNAFSLEQMTLETDLRQAVTNGELRLYYQPQVDLITAQVTAVEALLRWEHPERGLLLPSMFLPFAEESGLIVALGHWVLQEASLQARIWHKLWADHAPTVSVNLSVRQIHETNLSNDVVAALEIAGLPPHLLGLEVTEGIMFERSGEALLTMQRLKELGVKLIIDDFGSGYSGLSYLKHIPADELKIDKSFVRGLDDDAGDRAIIEAIHTLAHSFAMRVVAEGVETSRQLAHLQAIGCDAGQGYYFSRPVPADELTPLVRDGCLISLARAERS